MNFRRLFRIGMIALPFIQRRRAKKKRARSQA